MKIFLSILAEAKIEDLLIFLETNWNTKVKNDFLEKLNLKMTQVSQLPQSCQQSKQFPGLYKCVVTKQTSFYYRININKEEIEVVTFFDNRQIKR
ncbi:type II toxin-antitoxin system RelE/ParE family toxin [Lacihabitans sp. CCS-44]|uniref:type II toxin-antitoxin system RelE/ParE family toxin n=1 Tax=Lacihabitans sp. CCS-44 TaxID=2487331 RepID=UPI0020CF64F2|nr:hypothetical protein [Lacihabitans sp. CCS-44]MCP9754224.1 type II toxin-antitoxin system RelE/ParE family toxin [Lacihabitans sp. CCS-44]